MCKSCTGIYWNRSALMYNKLLLNIFMLNLKKKGRVLSSSPTDWQGSDLQQNNMVYIGIKKS